MTSPDQNEPTTMETYLEALQHNRGAGGDGSAVARFGFTAQFTPTFGYVGDVESAERARGEYERLTGSRFSTYRQSKDFGKKDFVTEHHKVCWEDCSKLRQGHIAFDHLPYIVIGIKMLDCQHGRDRHLAKKRRSLEALNAEPPDPTLGGRQKRKQIVGKKVDCPAQIYYRDILKFPEYAITANSVWRRKTMSEKLRKALAADAPVTGERRIYVKFPEHDEHQGHETESINLAAVVDVPKVSNRLESLVSDVNTAIIENTEPSEVDTKAEREQKVKTSDALLAQNSVCVPSQGVMSIPPNFVDRPSELMSVSPTLVDHPLEECVQGEGSKKTTSLSFSEAPPPPLTETRPARLEGGINQQVEVSAPCATVVRPSSCSDATERATYQVDSSPVASDRQESQGRSGRIFTDASDRGDATVSCQGNPLNVQDTALSTEPPDASILSGAATRCRRVLQQLMRETYAVGDAVVLERACEQLLDVCETLESGKRKEDVVTRTDDDIAREAFSSACGTPTEELPKGQTHTSKKHSRKRGNDDIREATRGSKLSLRSKHQKKLPQIICEELSSDGPLSDTTMQHAQRLMVEKFPQVKNFENPALGSHMPLSTAEGSVGQLMKVGEQHWVFVSTIGCEGGKVRYFDSLGTPEVPSDILKQIAAIMCTQDRAIAVEIPSLQRARSAADTGLFALAFAFSILHSEDPAQVSYDVSVMHRHLHRCLQESHIQPFPKMAEEAAVPRTVRRTLMVEVFCMCRMPWSANAQGHKVQMAQCESCEEWYHSDCCGIPDKVFTGSHSWKCPRCEDIQSVVTALNSLQAAIIHAQAGT